MKTNPNYPLDLDSGLTYTRYPTQFSMHPYPQAIGSVQVAQPLMDPFSISGVGRIAYGVNPEDNVNQFSQIEFYNMLKVRG